MPNLLDLINDALVQGFVVITKSTNSDSTGEVLVLLSVVVSEGEVFSRYNFKWEPSVSWENVLHCHEGASLINGSSGVTELVSDKYLINPGSFGFKCSFDLWYHPRSDHMG